MNFDKLNRLVEISPFDFRYPSNFFEWPLWSPAVIAVLSVQGMR